MLTVSTDLLSHIQKEKEAGRLPPNVAWGMQELYHNYRDAVYFLIRLSFIFVLNLLKNQISKEAKVSGIFIESHTRHNLPIGTLSSTFGHLVLKLGVKLPIIECSKQHKLIV